MYYLTISSNFASKSHCLHAKARNAEAAEAKKSTREIKILGSSSNEFLWGLWKGGCKLGMMLVMQYVGV